MMNLISRRLSQSTSFLLTGSKGKVKNQLEKLFPIQANGICHKNDLDPDQMELRLPPFDYKNKKLTYFHRFYKLEGFHPTLGKFTENTKVVVVEGNVGAGKDALAKRLADDLGMEYFPDIDADLEYKMDDGWDYRDLNEFLHADVKYADFKSVLESQNPYQAGYWEMNVLRLRVYTYLKALVHLLNTVWCGGDGVVLERSPWSGTVFARTGKDMNLLSQNYLDHYWEVRSAVFRYMYRPHVIIYLDVPVDQCLENAKKRNIHDCGSFLTEDYLESVENNYKKHFLPIISEHAEIFTYKLNKPVTDETAGDLSEMVVDELSRSDMDEYMMRIASKSEKFDDWRTFDSDERLQEIRMTLTNDKSDIRRPLEYYPYYVDELWPSYGLLAARLHVTLRELDKRHKRLYQQMPWKERIFGKKMTYEEKDALDWYIKTGYPPDQVAAFQ